MITKEIAPRPGARRMVTKGMAPGPAARCGTCEELTFCCTCAGMADARVLTLSDDGDDDSNDDGDDDYGRETATAGNVAVATDVYVGVAIAGESEDSSVSMLVPVSQESVSVKQEHCLRSPTTPDTPAATTTTTTSTATKATTAATATTTNTVKATTTATASATTTDNAKAITVPSSILRLGLASGDAAAERVTKGTATKGMVDTVPDGAATVGANEVDDGGVATSSAAGAQRPVSLLYVIWGRGLQLCCSGWFGMLAW